MLAVILYDGPNPVFYGPFSYADSDVAQRFADYLTAEVDPARVVPAGEFSTIRWTSPVRELLNWRDTMRSRVVEVAPCTRCGQSMPVDHRCQPSELAARMVDKLQTATLDALARPGGDPR